MKNLYNYDYRADTTTCQFNNTIWLFGCSNIYGYDLEEEQTAAAVLEKMINAPKKEIKLNVKFLRKSGQVYFLRITTNNDSEIKKIVSAKE